MKLSTYLSHAVAKPLVAGLAAGVADHYLMKKTDLTSNLYFGAAVGGGILAVSWVEPLITPYFPTKTPLGMVGKALEGRIVEIALGSGAAFAMNRYVLKNDYTQKDLLMRLGITAAADILGETVCELLIIV